MRKWSGSLPKVNGCDIPYQIEHATDYLKLKNPEWKDGDIESFIESNDELFETLNIIIALYHSITLLWHTTHSCQSLPDSLYNLKEDLIIQAKDKYNFVFDKGLMEEHNASRHEYGPDQLFVVYK